jgi:hypothetical protein
MASVPIDIKLISFECGLIGNPMASKCGRWDILYNMILKNIFLQIFAVGVLSMTTHEQYLFILILPSFDSHTNLNLKEIGNTMKIKCSNNKINNTIILSIRSIT